jgi:hypothetical protein
MEGFIRPSAGRCFSSGWSLYASHTPYSGWRKVPWDGDHLRTHAKIWRARGGRSFYSFHSLHSTPLTLFHFTHSILSLSLFQLINRRTTTVWDEVLSCVNTLILTIKTLLVTLNTLIIAPTNPLSNPKHPHNNSSEPSYYLNTLNILPKQPT